jgi:hypothetical protein
MKYIITEEQLRLLEFNASVRRRLHIAKEYMSELDPKDVCNNWNRSGVDEYVTQSLSDMTVQCITDLEDYDEVYDYLANKYESELEEFFYNSLCE